MAFLHFYDRIALITLAASPRHWLLVFGSRENWRIPYPTCACRCWQPSRPASFLEDRDRDRNRNRDRWQQVSGGGQEKNHQCNRLARFVSFRFFLVSLLSCWWLQSLWSLEHFISFECWHISFVSSSCGQLWLLFSILLRFLLGLHFAAIYGHDMAYWNECLTNLYDHSEIHSTKRARCTYVHSYIKNEKTVSWFNFKFRLFNWFKKCFRQICIFVCFFLFTYLIYNLNIVSFYLT